MRLIDADALKKDAREVTVFCDYGGESTFMAVDVENIDYAPTIDAEPVRHGRWIHGFTFMPLPEGCMWANCSLCNADYRGLKEQANYCFNCGAKMDLKEGV